MSRSINIPYSRNLEMYFEQLYEQEVDPILQTYYHKFKDSLTCPSVTEFLPEPVVNDRTRMMFNQMYPVIKNDRIVLTHISEAMFGPNMMTELTQVLEGDLPVEPWEILGSNDPQHEGHILSPKKSWPEAIKRIDAYVKARKTDLVVMTSFRMAMVCNDKGVSLDAQQIDNLCEFIAHIPEDIGMDIMRKLLYTEGPKTQFWRETLLRWKSPDGTKAGPLAEKFMVQHKRINTAVQEQADASAPSKKKK